MIQLEFKIISCYREAKKGNQKFKEIVISNKYRSNEKLETILKNIYETYGIDNDNTTGGWKKNCDIFFIDHYLWSQYFTNDIIYYFCYTPDDYMKMAVSSLEKQFHISKIQLLVHLNRDGKGGTSGRSEGISFFFHTNEKDLHHIPHIHCKYSGIETRVNLKTLEVMDKPFKKKKMKLAIDKIKKNQIDLLNYWDIVIVNGEEMNFKMVI